MSNLAQRLLTAFIAIPIVFVLLWFCDYSRIGLMCFLAGVGAWEWAGMVSKMYKGPDMRYLSFAASFALTLAWALASGGFFGLTAVPQETQAQSFLNNILGSLAGSSSSSSSELRR